MNTKPNKYLLATLLLLQGMCFSLRAQVPSIKVAGKESGLERSQGGRLSNS